MSQNRTNVAKWDTNILILLFSLLFAVIILILCNIDTVITSIVAILGLAIIWFISWRRGMKLFTNFYQIYMGELTSSPEAYDAKFTIARESLTPREKEILTLIAHGLPNKLIAVQLGISINTVKIFVSRIIEKFEASDRTEAAVLAIKNRLISLE
ncbi:response regulator transcription factor [Chloroflexota bacterium]